MTKSATVYDPIKYNAWVDAQLSPSDRGDASRALARRVKMHEFIMTGGVIISDGTKNGTGITTYGPPVDPTTNPECPWHGEGCSAWREIAEGRGYGAFDGPTLRELRDRTPEEIEEARKADEVERIARVQNIDRVIAKKVSDAYDTNRDAWGPDKLRETKAEALARKAREDREAASADLADAANALGDEIVIDGDEDEEVNDD